MRIQKLTKDTAIRIETFPNGKSIYHVYVFMCSNCNNEIRTRTTYMHKHTGLCRSCSSKKSIKNAHVVNRLRPYEAKYNIFKTKCPETDLLYEDYLEFTKIDNCHYCSEIIPWKEYGENNPGFWLDRKNNKKGHLKGNLVVCCGECNYTKADRYSYEEFLLFSPILREIKKNRKFVPSFSE